MATDKNFIVKHGLEVGGVNIVDSSGILSQSLITSVPSGAVASTQSVGDSSTALATTAYVRGEIDALINSAPGTLNTLDELAAAINDDAAFNTTLTNAVALKAPLASPTFTGNITVGGTVDGIDIAARDAVLTSTTTTAGAALPKAGGTMTGGLIVQAATGQLRLQGTSNTNKNVSIFYNESADYGQINVDESGVNQKDLWITGLNLKFGRNTTTERMRIDASGHVLIGKTSTAFGTAGISLRSEDVIQATRSAEPALEVNRLSTDGEIAGFYKDSARIGSIGVSSGSMYIEGNPATGKVGLTLFGSSIEPRDAGSASNGAVDLGATGSRFKDAHFSGTVKANGIAATDVDLTISNSADGIYFGSGFFRPYTADDNVISLGSATARFKDLYLSNKVYAAYIGASSDTDTSINFDTANTIKMFTGGDERVRIDSSGKVGIGTGSVTPNKKLHIKDASNYQLQIQGDDSFWNIGAGWSGYYQNSFLLANNTGDKLVIDPTGKVGIGISSPTQKLDVAGTALVENAKLKAIAESNTDTAIDVFVYDTRKDSDGGAWRKRTQHTS